MNEFEEYELYHHGILGQKWGIRRYQNKDGSLTAAGQRRLQREETKAAISSIKERAKAESKMIKAQSKVDAKIAKAEAKAQIKINAAREKARARVEAASAKTLAKAEAKKQSTEKTKSIKDMSNDELQAKINRIRLENQLRELTPEKKSSSKQFVSKFVNDSVQNAVLEGSKRALTNAAQAWVQKQFNIDFTKEGKIVNTKSSSKESGDGESKQTKTETTSKSTKETKTEKQPTGLGAKVKSLNEAIAKSVSEDALERHSIENIKSVGGTIAKELGPEVAGIVNTVTSSYKEVKAKEDKIKKGKESLSSKDLNTSVSSLLRDDREDLPY